MLFLLLFAVAAAVFLLFRRRLRLPSIARAAAPADPRIMAISERFDALARRVGRIEALVTSQDFDLNRRFREMGD